MIQRIYLKKSDDRSHPFPTARQKLGFDEAGYVEELKIKETKIRGEEFRKWMDLPSAHFSIDELEGNIRFTVKGLGHGAGLSQYGANEMAKRGYTYREIINYYYQDVEIKPYGA